MGGRQPNKKKRGAASSPAVPFLTSSQNPHYKAIKRAVAGKNSSRHDLLALEGVRLCEAAVAAGCRPLICLLAADQVTSASRSRLADLVNRCMADPTCRVWRLSPDLFNRLTKTDRPQGILLLVSLPADPTWLSDPTRLDRGLLIAAGVQDPGNLGTLIRTADAFGLDGFVTDRKAASFYNDKVVRSTMGSLFNIGLARIADLAAYLQQLKAAGVLLIAAVLPGEPLPDLLTRLRLEHELGAAPGRPRLAVLVGNEGAGLPPELIALADYKAYIPIVGGAESLNVAVAAGILCYSFFGL